MAVANAVALKLPSFWSSQPAVWFTQAEAQFHIRKITDDQTKYYYVVASLDQETANRLLDMLQSPPDADKYQALKGRLLETFGLSRRDRATKLLHISSLGDRKPSQLMDEMLCLLQDNHPCLLFEQLFLEKMPDDIRLQLANQSFDDPRAVARYADILWQARSHSAWPTVGNTPVYTASVHATAAKAGPAKQKSRPRRYRESGESPSGDRMCFYHTRFGDKATKCESPCSYSGNDQTGRQ